MWTQVLSDGMRERSNGAVLLTTIRSATIMCAVACGARTELDIANSDAGTPNEASIDGSIGIPLLALDDEHACYSARNGTLKCWGRSPNGEVEGDGGLITVSTPSSVPTNGTLTALVSHDGNCVLLSNGDVDCWDVFPPYFTTSTPPWIAPPPGHKVVGHATSLFAAPFGDFVCAGDTGGLTCWGYLPGCTPWYADPGYEPGPVLRPDISALQSLALGQTFLCGITNAMVLCCGVGDLGDGTQHLTGDPRNSLAPVALPPAVRASQVAIGLAHACAVLADTTAWCWGWNNHGQVGDGSIGGDRLTPTAVVGLSGVAELGLGGFHSCARLSDGTVSCWGDNEYGQLGDATMESRVVPGAVVSANGSGSLSNVVTIKSGGDYSCALVTSGDVYCWGRNDYGQLGDGTTVNRVIPTKVIGLP